MTTELRLALIGAGFIGKSHALAMHAVNHVFPDCPIKARPFVLAEGDDGRARAAAAALGFPEWTSSWEQAVDRADAVVIAVPSALHFAIASRAIAARKPEPNRRWIDFSRVDDAGLADALDAP